MRMEREEGCRQRREKASACGLGGKNDVLIFITNWLRILKELPDSFPLRLSNKISGWKEQARGGCSWKQSSPLQVSQTGLGLPSRTHLVSQPCWPNYKVILLICSSANLVLELAILLHTLTDSRWGKKKKKNISEIQSFFFGMLFNCEHTHLHTYT